MPTEDTPLIPEEAGETPIPEPAEPMPPEPEDITPRLAADFITLTDDEVDPTLRGVRVLLEMRLYAL